MRRLVGKVVIWVLVVGALIYVVDFAVWRVRGGGMGMVMMTRVVVAPLKGNKEEYYPDGTVEVGCSESIFEQAGGGACWWLRRHRQVEER